LEDDDHENIDGVTMEEEEEEKKNGS